MVRIMREYSDRQCTERFLKKPTAVVTTLLAGFMGLACGSSGLKTGAGDAASARGGQAGGTIGNGSTGGVGGSSLVTGSGDAATLSGGQAGSPISNGSTGGAGGSLGPVGGVAATPGKGQSSPAAGANRPGRRMRVVRVPLPPQEGVVGNRVTEVACRATTSASRSRPSGRGQAGRWKIVKSKRQVPASHGSHRLSALQQIDGYLWGATGALAFGLRNLATGAVDSSLITPIYTEFRPPDLRRSPRRQCYAC
jgi:hypothetical protein